jgi:hypothetical protein
MPGENGRRDVIEYSDACMEEGGGKEREREFKDERERKKTEEKENT